MEDYLDESPYQKERRRQIDAELDRVVEIANREADRRIAAEIAANACPF